MSLNVRIKEVRQKEKLNQSEFAKKIKITRSSVCKLESGENNPSDQTLKLISTEFKVRYDWLKYGTGEMQSETDDAFMAALDKIMTGDNDFIKSVFRDLASLPPEAWVQIESFVCGLHTKPETDIDTKVGNYRQELLSQKKAEEKSSALPNTKDNIG